MTRSKFSILLASLFAFGFFQSHLLAQNVAQPAKSTKVTDFSELLSCIPKELHSGLRSGDDIDIAKARDVFNENVRQKKVVLEFRFSSMEKVFEPGGDKIKNIVLHTIFEKARVNGTNFYYSMSVFLPASAVDQASKLRVNDRVRASVSIRGASFTKTKIGPRVMMGVEGTLE